MIIPIKCFTCGTLLADKYRYYCEEVRKRKKPVGNSWRMDETYIKVKGERNYLYQAVDKFGNIIDFLLTKNSDKKAARKFFKKAINANEIPE